MRVVSHPEAQEALRVPPARSTAIPPLAASAAAPGSDLATTASPSLLRPSRLDSTCRLKGRSGSWPATSRGSYQALTITEERAMAESSGWADRGRQNWLDICITPPYCVFPSVLFSAAAISSQDGARQIRTSCWVPEIRVFPSGGRKTRPTTASHRPRRFGSSQS